MLARSMARELAGRGIRVNVVAPGIVMAGMARRQYETDPDYARRASVVIPLGEFGTAEQIAKATAFLCSPDADYMTGSVLLVDGGGLPLPVRRVLARLRQREAARSSAATASQGSVYLGLDGTRKLCPTYTRRRPVSRRRSMRIAALARASCTAATGRRHGRAEVAAFLDESRAYVEERRRAGAQPASRRPGRV